MFLVALPHRRLSFAEPSAELVPFAVVIAQSVCLFTAGTADRLLVWKRINLYGSAVDDFYERDCHALASQNLFCLLHQSNYPRQMLTKFRRHVGCQCHYG
jgi:hypothetical protein